MARGPEHRPKVPALGLSKVGAARQRSGKHTAAEDTAWAAAEAGTSQDHSRGVSPGRGWRKSQGGGPRPAGLVRALCGVEGTAGGGSWEAGQEWRAVQGRDGSGGASAAAAATGNWWIRVYFGG